MSQTLKHLLIITPGFPENEEDSNCIPALQQIALTYKALFPQTRITILTLHYPFFRQQYSWNGIEVFSMRGKNGAGIRTAMTMGRGFLKGLRLHRQNRIDSILCLWLRDTSLVGKLLSRLLNIPYTIWMWGQDAKPGNKYFKRVGPSSNDLIMMSDWINDVLYQSYGIRAAHVVNNGINKAIFPEFNNGARAIDLFAAGSFSDFKQYNLFIELVAYVKDNGFPDVKAVLAGDGEMEVQLRGLIQQYSLQENITMAGRISHTETLNKMNNSRLFIHPSLYEGHSTVILEAMYSGCKVLAFIAPGNRPSKNFFHCSGFEDMKQNAVNLLSHDTAHERENYSDMEDCIRQLNSILVDKLK